jgi:hypothetical protein
VSKEKVNKERVYAGALITAFAGLVLLIEGLTIGGVWRIAGGVLFAAFGIMRCVWLSRKSSEERWF